MTGLPATTVPACASVAETPLRGRAGVRAGEPVALMRPPDARVDQPVGEVDHQVQHRVEQRHRQDEALDRREVGGDQRLDRVGADARPGKDLLDQHVGTEQEGEDHAQRRHHRQQGVAQRIGDDDPAARQAGSRAVRTKSAASTASIAARVMRAMGARAKIASVRPGRAIWLSAARKVSASPAARLSMRKKRCASVAARRRRRGDPAARAPSRGRSRTRRRGGGR